MTFEVREALVNSFRGIGDDLDQSTNILMHHQKNPLSIFEFISILITDKEFQVQKAATIHIKKLLKSFWKRSFVGSDEGETIKSQIINALESIVNIEVKQNIVYSMEPIFDTDADTWDEVHQYIMAISTGDEELISFDLFLCQHFIHYLSEDKLIDFLPFLIDLAQRSFSIGNNDAIVNVSGLSSMIVRLIPTEKIEMITCLYQTQIEHFILSLNNPSLSSDLALRLEFSFRTALLPIDPVTIINYLLDFYESNIDISRDACIKIFDVLTELISENGQEIEDTVPKLIPICLDATARLFKGENFEQEEDTYFVSGTIEALSTSCASKFFYNCLKENLNFEDESTMTASVFALLRCIESLSEQILYDIGFILTDVLIPALESDVICAKEAAVLSFEDIATYLQEGQNEIGMLMLNSLISQFEDTDDESLLSHTLKAMTKVLSNSNISDELIPDLTEKLILFITNDILIEDAMEALSSLIFSADHRIVCYLEDIYPLVVEGVQVSNECSPIKQNSIEALGNLLRFCKDELSNVSQEAVELIISCSTTDDLDTLSAVIVAIENLIIIKLPIINNYKEEITIIGNRVFDLYEDISTFLENMEEEEDCNENDDDICIPQNKLRLLTDGILLVKNIFKYEPDLIPESPDKWVNGCLRIMKCSSDDLVSAATLASTWIWIRLIPNEENPTDFYHTLLNILEEMTEQDLAIGSAFRAFSRLMENDIEIKEEILDEAFEHALSYLNEISANNDFHSTTREDRNTNLFRFFATIATKSPHRIGARFIDQSKSLMTNIEQNFEESLCLGVLRQFYTSSTEIDTIIRRTLIKTFVENLEVCDFQVIPEPLLALRSVYEREPYSLKKYLGDIIEFCSDILQTENSGELHFYSTQAGAMSLLCSLIVGGEIFSDDVIEYIFNALPVRGDEMEAEHIYKTMLQLASNEYNEDPSLLRAITASLSLPQNVIDKWKLSDGTYKGLLDFVKSKE